MLGQKLVIQEEFYNSLTKKDNQEILKSYGYNSPSSFLNAIISKLNEEFNYLEISEYRFAVGKDEKTLFGQYSAFVEGDDLPYKKIVIFFTPINSKLGNVIIEQSVMPTICNQMEKDITFLVNDNYKKIILLTSKINKNNQVSTEYNTLQMNINSLNTMHFDVIPFFPIKNLSTDTNFNSLEEYLEMNNFLQQKVPSNAQNRYLIIKNRTLYGNCEKVQLKGEFLKSFCFKFLTAILAGGNDYLYNIDSIIAKIGSQKLDNQFKNLQRFIYFANINSIAPIHLAMPIDSDIIESNDEISNINDIHRLPEKAIDEKGRKRFKTQRKIKDKVFEDSNFLCNCDNPKHFYFESVELHNYVEGHHIVPMNRQEEYYNDKKINLDNPFNLIPLCPNCHCQIHLGSRQARLKILSEIYIRNRENLLKFDEDITLSILASYYNIGLNAEEEKEWIKKAQQLILKKIN